MSYRPDVIEICHSIVECKFLGVTYYDWTVWRRETHYYVEDGEEYQRVWSGRVSHERSLMIIGPALWSGSSFHEEKARERVVKARLKADRAIQRAYYPTPRPEPRVIQELCTTYQHESGKNDN